MAEKPNTKQEDLLREAFERFPYGIMVVDGRRRVLLTNPALRELLGDVADADGRPTRECCELLGCGTPGGPLERGCLTDLALRAGEPLPEIRVDLPPTAPVAAVWITAAPLGEENLVVFEIRRGDPKDRRRRTVPHWMGDPELRVYALGRTRVESREGPLEGDWLEHRPGKLLKFLLCERHRLVHVDEIADALWPNPGPATRNNVRHFIHVLRERLEPTREKRAPSLFVVARQGGYTIDDNRVMVDADEFERFVDEGLAALAEGEEGVAAERLEQAVDLYKGDFLADEPYADWAFAERDRLRERAVEALQSLAEIKQARGDLDGASANVQRLADMDPFDTDVQRQLIKLSLLRGRRSEAVRRYAALQARMAREFGERPDFDLAELSRELSRSPQSS
jgi:DNA-binding SARP family transcriptional activator